MIANKLLFLEWVDVKIQQGRRARRYFRRYKLFAKNDFSYINLFSHTDFSSLGLDKMQAEIPINKGHRPTIQVNG